MRTFTNFFAIAFTGLFIFSADVFGITRISSCSGNWATASTWNPAGAPACGDSVVIQASHTISINNQQNYTGCSSPLKIVIDGKLHFMNGSKLSLPCGSYILVHAGGLIDADVGLANSNLIEICGNVEWNSNAALNGPACIPASHPVCRAALPIELVSFSARNCDHTICLNWETASETNNRHFELQRSADGISYESITKVNSKAVYGNSSYRINYDCSDNAPLTGINYYRLKQVDLNGSYSYCKPISIDNDVKKSNQFIVFPNVNSGEFSAQLKGLSNSGDVIILLRNSSGEIVYKSWQYVNDSSEPIRVAPAKKLQNGVYYCSLLMGSDEYVMKVVLSDL